MQGRVNKWAIYLLAIFFCQSALGKQMKHDPKVWTIIKTKGDLNNSKYSYIGQVHGRFGFESPVFNAGIIRAGLGYKSSKKLSFWLGYDFFPFQNLSTKNFYMEQRLWQQISWKIDTTSPSTISFRSRLEERVRSRNSGIALRFRQKCTIKNRASKNSSSPVPVIFDEIFLNINHQAWTRNSYGLIDQNRFFIGYEFHPKINSALQIGYMNQTLLRRNKNQMNHILYISYLFY